MNGPLADIDIKHISLHNIRPLLFHGYVAPFVCLYGVWIYVWLVVYGVQEYFEAGLIALAMLGLLQILCCLFCHWFMDVRCALTCSKVMHYLASVLLKSARL